MWPSTPQLPQGPSCSSGRGRSLIRFSAPHGRGRSSTPIQRVVFEQDPGARGRSPANAAKAFPRDCFALRSLRLGFVQQWPVLRALDHRNRLFVRPLWGLVRAEMPLRRELAPWVTRVQLHVRTGSYGAWRGPLPWLDGIMPWCQPRFVTTADIGRVVVFLPRWFALLTSR